MNSGRIIAVGAGSFLCRALMEADPADVVPMSWQDALQPGSLSDADCIVNFSLNPACQNKPISDADDMDVRLAESICRARSHYIMISSRAAYAPHVQWGAHEEADIGGISIYGENKARTERRVVDILGSERVTLVRCANVIGREWMPGYSRRSFMARMMSGLASENRIIFDMSPFVRRDFVTAPHFAELMDSIIRLRPPGPINLASGVAVMTGELALWLIEGYGAGELLIQNPRMHDEFLLNVRRLHDLSGLSQNREDIADYCITLGRILRNG